MANVLLFRPRKSNLLCPVEEDEDVGEEADEVVPDGVEEVELAKIVLEKKEREQKLLLQDIRILSVYGDAIGDGCLEHEANLWMITCGRPALVSFGLSSNTLSLFTNLLGFLPSCYNMV